MDQNIELDLDIVELEERVTPATLSTSTFTNSSTTQYINLGNQVPQVNPTSFGSAGCY